MAAKPLREGLGLVSRALTGLAVAAIIASTVGLAAAGQMHITDNVANGLFGASCKTSDRSVIVDLDNRKHRHILDHIWDAQRGDERQSVPSSRDGKPEARLLHWDPEDADKHRAQSLKGIPTRKGYDRDEVPPAASREGGKGADVRYIASAENRSAGSVMGEQLRPFCAGQAFRFEKRPR